jgi:hypothetical protein
MIGRLEDMESVEGQEGTGPEYPAIPVKADDLLWIEITM